MMMVCRRNVFSYVLALLMVIAAGSGNQHVALACPYLSAMGAGAHRRLLEEVTQLEGSPSMENNAFMGQTLLADFLPDTSSKLPGLDWLAQASTYVGEDVCLISMQQLPPPKSTGYDYGASVEDLSFLIEWGDKSVKRFHDFTGPDKNGGSVFLSACTIGKKGAEAACKIGVEGTRYCDPSIAQTSTAWSQAIVGWRVNTTNLEQARQVLTGWRSEHSGHLTPMTWSMAGGDLASGGSVNRGWGNDGGLRSKLVRCSSIDPKFMYPTHSGAANLDKMCDYTAPGETTTFAQQLLAYWESLCSEYPPNGSCGTGSTPPPPAATPTPPPQEATPDPPTPPPQEATPDPPTGSFPQCTEAGQTWWDRDFGPGERAYVVEPTQAPSWTALKTQCLPKAKSGGVLDPAVETMMQRSMFWQFGKLACRALPEQLGFSRASDKSLNAGTNPNRTTCEAYAAAAAGGSSCDYPGPPEGMELIAERGSAQDSWYGPLLQIPRVNNEEVGAPNFDATEKVTHSLLGGVSGTKACTYGNKFYYDGGVMGEVKRGTQLTYRTFQFKNDVARKQALMASTDTVNPGLKYAGSFSGSNGCDLEVVLELGLMNGGGLNVMGSIPLESMALERELAVRGSVKVCKTDTEIIVLAGVKELREAQNLVYNPECEIGDREIIRFSRNFICKATGQAVTADMVFHTQDGETMDISDDCSNPTPYLAGPNKKMKLHEAASFTMSLDAVRAPTSCGAMYWDPLLAPLDFAVPVNKIYTTPGGGGYVTRAPTPTPTTPTTTSSPTSAPTSPPKNAVKTTTATAKTSGVYTLNPFPVSVVMILGACWACFELLML